MTEGQNPTSPETTEITTGINPEILAATNISEANSNPEENKTSQDQLWERGGVSQNDIEQNPQILDILNGTKRPKINPNEPKAGLGSQVLVVKNPFCIKQKGGKIRLETGTLIMVAQRTSTQRTSKRKETNGNIRVEASFINKNRERQIVAGVIGIKGLPKNAGVLDDKSAEKILKALSEKEERQEGPAESTGEIVSGEPSEQKPSEEQKPEQEKIPDAPDAKEILSRVIAEIKFQEPNREKRFISRRSIVDNLERKLAALKNKNPQNPLCKKYQEVIDLLTGNFELKLTEVGFIKKGFGGLYITLESQKLPEIKLKTALPPHKAYRFFENGEFSREKAQEAIWRIKGARPNSNGKFALEVFPLNTEDSFERNFSSERKKPSRETVLFASRLYDLLSEAEKGDLGAKEIVEKLKEGFEKEIDQLDQIRKKIELRDFTEQIGSEIKARRAIIEVLEGKQIIETFIAGKVQEKADKNGLFQYMVGRKGPYKIPAIYLNIRSGEDLPIGTVVRLGVPREIKKMKGKQVLVICDFEVKPQEQTPKAEGTKLSFAPALPAPAVQTEGVKAPKSREPEQEKASKFDPQKAGEAIETLIDIFQSDEAMGRKIAADPETFAALQRVLAAKERGLRESDVPAIQNLIEKIEQLLGSLQS